MRRIRLIFWCHFIVCLVAHVLGPLCIIAAVRWCFGASQLDFWDKCLILGANYAGAVYLANHVLNPNGFCSLTDLEQHYRNVEDLPECGPAFLPRFYTKCRQLRKGDFSTIPL